MGEWKADELAFHLAVFAMIALRTTNMWSHSAASERVASLRAFRERAPLFRVGMLVSGGAIGLMSLASGAHGHGVANLYIGLLAALPPRERSSAAGRLVLALARADVRWVGAALVVLAASAFSTRGPAYALNLLGAWLLVSAFSGMILDVWGAGSSGSRRYALLCLVFDLALLVSAALLGVLPLVVLEVYALAMDALRLAQLRGARVRAAGPER
jgi:hypothetical protein